MSNRQLVVVELDKADPQYGAMFGLPPGRATGVAIPAFRSGPTLPLTGTVEGEAFFVEATKVAHVWNGSTWNPIVPATLLTYPTQTALLDDASPSVGSYAVSIDTGNLFTKVATGWRQIGIHAFGTQAALLAATNVGDGDAAIALDTGALYTRVAGKWRNIGVDHVATFAALKALAAPYAGQRVFSDGERVMFHYTGSAWEAESIWTATEVAILNNTDAPENVVAFSSDTNTGWQKRNGVWMPLTIRTMVDLVDIKAWAAPDGAQAVAKDTGVIYARVAGAWVSKTHLIDTEANILANMTALDGQVAVATDTGRMYTKIAGAWVGTPIQHYDTEAALLAATVPEGVLAWGSDTQVPYVRTATGWKSLAGGPKVTVGVTAPANPSDGDFWLDEKDPSATRGLNVRVGAVWKPVVLGKGWEVIEEWDALSDGTKSFTADWTKFSEYRLELFSRANVWIKSANALSYTGVQTSHKVGATAYSGDTTANTERQVVPDNYFFRGVWTFSKDNAGVDFHLHTDGSENIVVKASGLNGLIGEFSVRWAGAGSGLILGLRK